VVCCCVCVCVVGSGSNRLRSGDEALRSTVHSFVTTYDYLKRSRTRDFARGPACFVSAILPWPIGRTLGVCCGGSYVCVFAGGVVVTVMHDHHQLAGWSVCCNACLCIHWRLLHVTPPACLVGMHSLFEHMPVLCCSDCLYTACTRLHADVATNT
jgi:hypothetical protein